MFRPTTIRVIASAALALLLLPTSAPAHAEAAGPDRCPAVAVVAARGSEQSDHLDPTVYGEGSPYISNGYEAENIRGFLQYSEQRHVDQHGTSLLADVPVLALDVNHYPAALPIPAIAEKDEELEAAEAARRVGALLSATPAHVIVQDAVQGLLRSLRTGTTSVIPAIDNYEARTGCAPDYILIGYSQGAIVLTAQERELASQGRLAGALYLGNPLLKPGESNVVGSPHRGGGILSSLPADVLPTASESVPRLNYCVTGDFACDLTDAAAMESIGSQGGGHADYFLDIPRTADDAYVADTFADWITGYTSPHD